MDFFEAQARAKKRTLCLVALFAVAVLGTIVAGYAAAILIFREAGPRMRESQHSYDSRQSVERWPEAQSGRSWWDPKLFACVSLGTLAVVGLASLYKWQQYAAGGSAVAESVGGRRVEPQTSDLHERRLLNVIEEMALASGTPVPAVYILEDETGINAFAAGLTTSDAAVAVTRGALEKLTRDELQGVIGHEFSHILNGDMRLNLRIAATIFGILVLGLAGRGILWSLRHTRVRSSREKNSGGVVAAILVVGLALLVIGYVGYFFGRIIQAAVSRQREFLADASAVQFTRNPEGMTGALKKIGGYALGSTMQSSKSAEIGHFFFAQAFRSGLAGLWSTHPPLEERIRAIDPRFDGKMFDPPQVVDVTRESFQTAGFNRGTRHSVDETARRAFAAQPNVPAPTPAKKIPYPPTSIVAAIGTLSAGQIVGAQDMIDSISPSLREAAHSPVEAPIVVFGLLLDDDAALRARQRNLISTRNGAEALRLLEKLEPALHQLGPAQKLPLLQLALPSLRQLAPTALSPFLDTLDELVHADEQVSSFEFALQKLLVHTLALGREPGAAVVQYHSFRAMAGEISVVLSVLARAAVTDAAGAPGAFATGAAQLKLVVADLHYLDAAATDLAALDTALDKLAVATLPIKQRTLTAAAHVVSADGEVRIAEAELLRAIAAALDVPMPPLVSAA